MHIVAASWFFLDELQKSCYSGNNLNAMTGEEGQNIKLTKLLLFS